MGEYKPYRQSTFFEIEERRKQCSPQISVANCHLDFSLENDPLGYIREEVLELSNPSSLSEDNHRYPLLRPINPYLGRSYSRR